MTDYVILDPRTADNYSTVCRHIGNIGNRYFYGSDYIAIRAIVLFLLVTFLMDLQA